MQCSPARFDSRQDGHHSGAPHNNGASEQPAEGPADTADSRQYLCYFLHRMLDFRVPELESLASLASIPTRLVPPDLRPDINAFWTCVLPSDDAARRLAKRSMLLKGFFEVYAEGDTMDQLVEAVRALPAATLAPYRHASWKVRQESRRRLDSPVPCSSGNRMLGCHRHSCCPCHCTAQH